MFILWRLADKPVIVICKIYKETKILKYLLYIIQINHTYKNTKIYLDKTKQKFC